MARDRGRETVPPGVPEPADSVSEVCPCEATLKAQKTKTKLKNWGPFVIYRTKCNEAAILAVLVVLLSRLFLVLIGTLTMDI